jgi:hypothetical protein
MELKHPLMRQGKGGKPQEQDELVQDRAPQEEFIEVVWIHGVSAISANSEI